MIKKPSNYVIQQNKLELWSSFLLAFFKLTKQKNKTTNNNKETKRECDEFRKGDIVASGRTQERERNGTKREAK